MTEKRLMKLAVGPESARMLELGHPWVIADAYTKKWPAGKPGELAELVDGSGRFLALALVDPQDRVVARVLARQRFRLDGTWLSGRFKAALALRSRHACLEGSTAWRLVNGEGDGLPGLTVDRYGDWLMVQLYCEGWRPHLPLVTEALRSVTGAAGIYEKTRPRNTRELEAVSESTACGRLLWGRPAPPRLEILENGLTFLVSLEQGLNSGLFLDQRANRRDLMRRSSGQRVLNLFAYTGAFSVAAAMAGAERVTSVDVSSSYTAWNRDNFSINRINPKRHEFIVGDCLESLAHLTRQGRHFDIVLMDPPSFSTTARGKFTTRGGTAALVAAALPLLDDNGLLISSSNHQKVDVADYLKELRRGALQSGADLRVISVAGQPEDFPCPVTFPEGRYLKYVTSVVAR